MVFGSLRVGSFLVVSLFLDYRVSGDFVGRVELVIWRIGEFVVFIIFYIYLCEKENWVDVYLLFG